MRIRSILTSLAMLFALCGPAFAQSNPGWGLNYVPSPSEWNTWWSKKVDQNAPTIPNITPANCANGSLIFGSNDNEMGIVFNAAQSSGCFVYFGRVRNLQPACVTSNSYGFPVNIATYQNGFALAASFPANATVYVICQGQ